VSGVFAVSNIVVPVEPTYIVTESCQVDWLYQNCWEWSGLSGF